MSDAEDQPGGAHAERSAALASALDAIGAVTREFAAQRRSPFGSHAVGRSGMDALFLLSRTDGLSIRALADGLGVTSSAATQLVDTLSAKGLVLSTPHPTDGRSRVIRLSRKARLEVDLFQREYAELLAPRFDTLSTREVVELAALLAKVELPR